MIDTDLRGDQMRDLATNILMAHGPERHGSLPDVMPVPFQQLTPSQCATRA